MTVRLCLSAMAQQGDGSGFAKLLEQPQGEFLAVVFDGVIATVNGAFLEQFLPVTAAKLAPGDPAIFHRVQEVLARSEIGHPNIITRDRHAPATKASGENPQAVRGWLDLGKY